MIKAILATGLNGEIGKNGNMPWGKSLPKDLEYFKKVTGTDTVIMGRKTWESLNLPKGLPDRDNWVITSQIKDTIWQDNGFNEVSFDNVELVDNILYRGHKREDNWELTLIGGASIYRQFWKYVDEVHLTTVYETYPTADTFFKPDLSNFEKVGSPIDVGSEDLGAMVQVWRRIS